MNLIEITREKNKMALYKALLRCVKDYKRELVSIDNGQSYLITKKLQNINKLLKASKSLKAKETNK